MQSHLIGSSPTRNVVKADRVIVCKQGTPEHSPSQMRGAEGTRTPDPLVANEVRYQLRYSPGRSEGISAGYSLTARRRSST